MALMQINYTDINAIKESRKFQKNYLKNIAGPPNVTRKSVENRHNNKK